MLVKTIYLPITLSPFFINLLKVLKVNIKELLNYLSLYIVNFIETIGPCQTSMVESLKTISNRFQLLTIFTKRFKRLSPRKKYMLNSQKSNIRPLRMSQSCSERMYRVLVHLFFFITITTISILRLKFLKKTKHIVSIF